MQKQDYLDVISRAPIGYACHCRVDIKEEESFKYLITEVNNGMDCDRNGCCDGYDYTETFIEEIYDIDYTLSSVDEIGEGTITVSVECKAGINAICYYDDYENAIWDSEMNEYLFLSQSETRENHTAEFGCVLNFSVSGDKENVFLNW